MGTYTGTIIRTVADCFNFGISRPLGVNVYAIETLFQCWARTGDAVARQVGNH